MTVIQRDRFTDNVLAVFVADFCQDFILFSNFKILNIWQAMNTFQLFCYFGCICGPDSGCKAFKMYLFNIFQRDVDISNIALVI